MRYVHRNAVLNPSTDCFFLCNWYWDILGVFQRPLSFPSFIETKLMFQVSVWSLTIYNKIVKDLLKWKWLHSCYTKPCCYVDLTCFTFSYGVFYWALCIFYHPQYTRAQCGLATRNAQDKFSSYSHPDQFSPHFPYFSYLPPFCRLWDVSFDVLLLNGCSEWLLNFQMGSKNEIDIYKSKESSGWDKSMK